MLQANYGAEHAKGPITIDAISKAGGRDFHGIGYVYLRDYRLNSNEWLLNKTSTVPGAENKPKNQFTYPGFNIGGPLLIPGTNFNKNRDKVFFFTGYEFYRQKLDTGHPAVVGADAGDAGRRFQQHRFVCESRELVRQRGPHESRQRPRSLESDRPGTAQRLINLFPLPNADPALTGGYNYVQNVPIDQNMHQWLSRVDVNISNNTRLFARYNLQAEEQNFPVGLWWRNGNQVPYPSEVTAPNRSHSATVSLTKVFGNSLTTESTFGITYIDFPNQFRDPSKVSRSALGYHQPRDLPQRPGPDSLDDGWGNGPTLFNPGGFDPVLFAKKWLISGAQNVTKVAGAHTMKAGAVLRVGEQQAAGQRQLERPADARRTPPLARAATTSRIS